MNLILTNFGHRYIKEQLSSQSTDNLKDNSRTRILLQVLKDKIVSVSLNWIHEDLINNGYLEIDSSKMDLNAINFKYKTNPIENVKRIVFEYTTKCNFNCSHCRNGYMEKTTETNIDKLKLVANTFNLLNINRYDFIGGEVSRYGNGWLDLANHINKNHNKTITIYTNGWWLENTNFEAAGKYYKNDREYLSDLKQNGITHILFSIDGHAEYHDKSRNQKGLYNKILSSFNRIKQSGIKPRITALLKDNLDIQTANAFAEIATLIYDLPENLNLNDKIDRLTQDSTNHFSNFIDIGNGAHLRKKRYKVNNIPLDLLRCKAFYRPAPSLSIMANGNLSVCPLLDAGEGYGNIHNQNITEIINNFQNNFIYKLHANNDIKNYLKYFDKNIFGEFYDHICSIRIILTLLAKYINTEGSLTQDKILKINNIVAQYSGFGEIK